MRLAIDYSSFAWTSLLGGKDEENGFETTFQDKKVWINSAIYGYDRIINMIVARMNHWGVTPQDVILVVEGMGSKLPRQIIASYYKGGSDKPPEAYEQFVDLREEMIMVWRNLGGTVIMQDNAEADDVMGWLAQETEEELVICSNDNDLSVLYREKNDHGVEVHCHIGELVDVNKYAIESEVMFDFPFITTYKALVGDTSDKIPGIHRFGPKSFGKLVHQFGLDGLGELQEMLEKGSLDEIADQAESNKTIKLLIDNEKAVVTSYRLAKIYPNWVNTLKDPIKIMAGMVQPKDENTDPRLAKWAGQKVLVTNDNFDATFRHLQAHLPLTKRVPAFDIETSTPPESDEWLALQGKGADAVDTLGSKLTGFSVTYGDNHQYTMYVSVKHRDTNNVSMVQARQMIAQLKRCVIHNLNFELPVLYLAQDEDGSLWRDHWKDNGYHGFVPNAFDTKLQCSYVNENIKLGLKLRSKVHLGYEQVTFEQVTQFTGEKGTLPAGGRLIREFDDIVDAPEQLDPQVPLEEGGQLPTKIVRMQTRQYKMDELSAEHVFDYGCDDTITTAALHVYSQLVMQLEHTWDIYRSVELYAAYQHAKNFVDGMPFSLQRCRELDKEDTEDFTKAWATVRSYLIEQGWAGTTPPVFTQAITAQEIKYAYRIVNDLVEGGFKMTVSDGEGDDDAPAEEDSEDGDEEEDDGKDPFLSTRTHKPSKLADLAESLGEATFAAALRGCLESEEGAEKFTKYVNRYFKGEPVFKFSSKQMCHLMYEVMGLDIVVRGKVSPTMRAKGIRIGNPAANELAIKYAIRDGDPAVKAVLEGLRVMKMVVTRKGLFYSKYPGFAHWMTGRIHGSHNQCQTNTRRASESKPNKQQLSKHVKVEGFTPKVREMIVPHHPRAVVVSLDFASQELRVIADYSKDPNMVACYVGDYRKDMHALTGLGIFKRTHKTSTGWTYEMFIEALEDRNHVEYKNAKECRSLGKKTNFTTEYGAMAPKLAATLMVTEEEAQAFIDAREAAFPVASAWKQSVIVEAKKKGYVTTMCGARRHLRDALRDPDGWIKLKAERQAVNFKIQSSSAEMTKLAEGRVWQAGLTYKYDAVCIGPVHDELVFSVMLDELEDFLVDAHKCMVAPYGGMTIPIESSISFGPNFGQQIEIGNEPTAEAIAAGIKELEVLCG